MDRARRKHHLPVLSVVVTFALALIAIPGCSPKPPACAPDSNYSVRLGSYILHLPGELSPDVRPFQGEKLRAAKRQAREHPCEPEAVEAITFRSRSSQYDGLPASLTRIAQVTFRAESSTFNPVRITPSLAPAYKARQIRGIDGKLIVDHTRRQHSTCTINNTKPTGLCYVDVELGGGLYAELAFSASDYPIDTWPDLFSRVDEFSQSLIYSPEGQ